MVVILFVSLSNAFWWFNILSHAIKVYKLLIYSEYISNVYSNVPDENRECNIVLYSNHREQLRVHALELIIISWSITRIKLQILENKWIFKIINYSIDVPSTEYTRQAFTNHHVFYCPCWFNFLVSKYQVSNFYLIIRQWYALYVLLFSYYQITNTIIFRDNTDKIVSKSLITGCRKLTA